MKTKKLFSATLALFIGLSFFVSTASAENTTGTVNFNYWIDQQSKSITMDLNWRNNTSFIEGVFYWDTVPGLYRNSATTLRFNADQYPMGNTTTTINNVVGCHQYYMKVEFTDGATGAKYIIQNNFRTPGDKKPLITKLQVPSTGFNFAEMLININGFCNGFNLKIKVGEVGKLPTIQYDENLNDENNTIRRILYGLEPDKSYEITVISSNYLGEETRQYWIQTRSNLLPTIESLNTTTDGNSIVCQTYIDPNNTETEWSVEYGEDVNLSQKSPWHIVNFGASHYLIYLNHLKPNTVYFWQSIARNDYGQNEGKMKLFKTNSTASGVTELQWNDLLRVSSIPNGIYVSVEKKGLIEVYDVTGSKLYSQECDKETDINLKPGVHIVKMYAGQQIITKKVLVF